MRFDAEKLIDLLEDADYQPQSYSGRAMYGRRCVGVTVEPIDSLRVGAELARQIAEEFDADTCKEPQNVADEIIEKLDAVAELMRGAREDSMGRDVIVYWPDVEWPDGRPDSDDEDDR